MIRYNSYDEYISNVLEPYTGEWSEEYDLQEVAEMILVWDDSGYFVEDENVDLDSVLKRNMF